MARWGKKKSGSRVLRLLLSMLILAALAGGTLLAVEAVLAPNIQAQASAAVHNQASKLFAQVINAQVEKDQDISSYQQLMDLQRDDQGRIIMLSVDTRLINNFSTELLSSLEDALSHLADQKITVPLFAASGSRFLASFGPELPVRVRGLAMPQISLSDSFIAAGINQTKHSIYLNVDAELMVAVPFDSERCHISASVLLAEGIIIGQIPETYLNFEQIR